MKAIPMPLVTAFFVLASSGHAAHAAPSPSREVAGGQLEASELAEARALFERNIAAIQARDREAYLACYAGSERLVRTSHEGMRLGFTGLAEGTPETGSADWPDALEAEHVRLAWIAPGLVYGVYEYEVTMAGRTSEGRSERLFRKTDDGWRIVVTTAFGEPCGSDDDSDDDD